MRYVFFAIVWVLTWGKHRFWLFPNLTEECGFFESFVPLYTHEYKANEAAEQGEHTTEQGEKEKDDGKAEDGNKDESSEDKEQSESWVKLTDEEVATAKNEVNKELEESNDVLTSEVKC